MTCTRRLSAVLAALAAGSLLIAGCGGGGGHAVRGSDTVGLVTAHTITYRSSSDGSRVTGLVAIPRAVASRGCVIWQFGLGSTMQDSSQAWQGLASLGLVTFSIDFRDQGARASSPDEYKQVIRNPNRLAEMIRGTVADLHSAVGFLERQPYCAHTVAYGGVSLGGIVGTILAATDRRVKALELIATPGSFRAVLTTPGDTILPGIARHPAQLAAALRVLSPLDPARFVGRVSPRPVLILSGRKDTTVLLSNARLLQAATRPPRTIIDYDGGHNPALGPAAAATAQAVASFLLRHVVEPSYGISGNENGTFIQQQ
ncbi:MAG: alpha/beta hydrolase family protein [Solirubrobacteraceae bacterium]